jgi:hypothetical protein
MTRGSTISFHTIIQSCLTTIMAAESISLVEGSTGRIGA